MAQGLTTYNSGHLREMVYDSLIDKATYYTYFNDFDSSGSSLSLATNSVDWVVTGTAAPEDDAGYTALKITPAASTNAEAGIQHTGADGAGEMFSLNSSKKLLIEARLKSTDISDSDIFFGLAETDSDLISAAGAIDGDTMIGCVIYDGDAGKARVVTRDAAGTAVTGSAASDAIADATWAVVAMLYDGAGKMHLYVDGVYQNSTAIGTQFADSTPVCVSLHATGVTSGQNPTWFDYIRIIVER